MPTNFNYVGYFRDHRNYLPSGNLATPANIYHEFGYDENPLVGGQYKHQIEYIPLTLMDEAYHKLKALKEAKTFEDKEIPAVSHVLKKMHTYLTLAMGQAAKDSSGRLFDEFDSLQEKLRPVRSLNPYYLANILFESMPDMPAKQTQKAGQILELIMSLIYGDALCGSIRIQNDSEALFIIKLLEHNVMDAITRKFTLDFGAGFQAKVDGIMTNWFILTREWLDGN